MPTVLVETNGSSRGVGGNVELERCRGGELGLKVAFDFVDVLWRSRGAKEVSAVDASETISVGGFY